MGALIPVYTSHAPLVSVPVNPIPQSSYSLCIPDMPPSPQARTPTPLMFIAHTFADLNIVQHIYSGKIWEKTEADLRQAIPGIWHFGIWHFRQAIPGIWLILDKYMAYLTAGNSSL